MGGLSSRACLLTFLVALLLLHASHAPLASAQTVGITAVSTGTSTAVPTSVPILTTKNSTCQKSPAQGYDCFLSVAPGRYDLHWALDTDILYVMAVANTTGWVAVGWSQNGQMVGSDAVIGPIPLPGGGLNVQAYRLGAKSVSGVTPNPNVTVLFASILSTGGQTRLEFARLINESRPGIVPVVAANGVTKRMLWAMSPDGTTALQYHGATNRMAYSVNFAPGTFRAAAVIVPNSAEAAYRRLAGKMRAHGWLMTIGVGVFLPLGVLASRYGKNRLPHWFYLHLVCQLTGVVLMTVGAIIAFSYFNALQQAESHAQIGLTVFILAWVQLLVALFRPSPGTRIRRLWFVAHWFLGTGVVIMGGISVFLGMALYHKYTGYGVQGARVVYAIFVSFYILAYLALDTFLKPAIDAAERARIQLSTFPMSGQQPGGFSDGRTPEPTMPQGGIAGYA